MRAKPGDRERDGERERIIMFPLLSRLPQLSLKRGSQSTCLLIHLKLGNNRTPLAVSLPSPPVCISSSHCFLTFFFFSRIKLLFIAPFPNMFSSPPSPPVSAPTSAPLRPPHPSVCVSPKASPHLSALRGF